MLDYQAEIAEHMNATRTLLGDTAFGAAWAEGRAMVLEQAIEYALAVEPGDEGQPEGRRSAD
jgi:hypothetical protein